MNRREALGAVAAATAAVAGCSSPTVTERPTGEVDVTFRTEADTEYTVRLSLTDGGGTVVEEFESPVPPGRSDGPSFYAGGLADGPYTLAVETAADAVELEWDPGDCASLAVGVTVTADGRLRVERDCSTA
ncbi:hypothetical protein [Halobaculum litoreum]|uniref:hypothetical protein n=1 Tax=Halobaculum litoreum TaxID=3031998 RepID=UPI0024C34B21|nr:hypothetical protein [Halobaculum sp. DT92]